MSRSSTSSLSVQVRRADLPKTVSAPELGGPYQHPDPRQGTRRWPMALHHGRLLAADVVGNIRGGAPDFLPTGNFQGGAPDFLPTGNFTDFRIILTNHSRRRTMDDYPDRPGVPWSRCYSRRRTIYDHGGGADSELRPPIRTSHHPSSPFGHTIFETESPSPTRRSRASRFSRR